MIQCPDCRNTIPDDSAFCDQCGKELMWCPECKRPKRGTQCPVCGNDLIPGRKYIAGIGAVGEPSPRTGPSGTASGEGTPPASKMEQQKPAPQPTATSAAALAVAGKLAGNGWSLPLREGIFGRTGGIWPELSTCQYVSGRHGNIGAGGPTGWTLTDVGSTNGTLVNGVKLQPNVPVSIKAGDKVRIATLDFIVE